MAENSQYLDPKMAGELSVGGGENNDTHSACDSQNSMGQ